ncbi:hypothetical protein AHAS_Ahas13G0090700 [Arachis hypogaea]
MRDKRSPHHQLPLALFSSPWNLYSDTLSSLTSPTSPSHITHLVDSPFRSLAFAHLYVLLLSVVVAVVDATSVSHLMRLANSRFLYFVAVAGSPPKSLLCSPLPSPPRVMFA